MSITVGDNSYIGSLDAAEYFAGRIGGEAFTAATSAEQEKALRTATTRIDRLIFVGKKADPDQKLQFPRALRGHRHSSYPVREMRYRSGWVYETFIPDCVKHACCEEALMLLAGVPKRLQLQNQNVKSFSMGDLSETFTGSRAKLASSEALDLLRPYMGGGVALC